MVGVGVQQVKFSHALERLAAYLAAVGIDNDVHASDLTGVLGIEPIRGGQHVGSYTGRFNYYQQRKGADIRIVVGRKPNTYRLVRLVA